MTGLIEAFLRQLKLRSLDHQGGRWVTTPSEPENTISFDDLIKSVSFFHKTNLKHHVVQGDRQLDCLCSS